jgi:hypothetical protein
MGDVILRDLLGSIMDDTVRLMQHATEAEVDESTDQAPSPPLPWEQEDKIHLQATPIAIPINVSMRRSNG